MMQTIEQSRAEIDAKIAARKAISVEKDRRDALVKSLRSAGRHAALIVTAGCPLVTVGGYGLSELREDVFDAAFNVNCRAGVSGIHTYATAMMGGEPFAVWH